MIIIQRQEWCCLDSEVISTFYQDIGRFHPNSLQANGWGVKTCVLTLLELKHCDKETCILLETNITLSEMTQTPHMVYVVFVWAWRFTSINCIRLKCDNPPISVALLASFPNSSSPSSINLFTFVYTPSLLIRPSPLIAIPSRKAVFIPQGTPTLNTSTT